MKAFYTVLYVSGILMLLISLMGGNLTRPFFDRISENALEAAGVKKAHVKTADDKIDDMFHMVRKIEYQVEKIKNIFSSGEIDESRYKKEQNRIITDNIYNPMVLTFNYVFRFGLLLTGLIFVLGGIIVHLIYNSRSKLAGMRRRIERLESIVTQNTV